MRFGACMRPLESLLGSLRNCLDRFPDKRRGIKHDLSHGRYRHGGLFGVFHARPLLPGTSGTAWRLGVSGGNRCLLERIVGRQKSPSEAGTERAIIDGAANLSPRISWFRTACTSTGAHRPAANAHPRTSVPVITSTDPRTIITKSLCVAQAEPFGVLRFVSSRFPGLCIVFHSPRRTRPIRVVIFSTVPIMLCG